MRQVFACPGQCVQRARNLLAILVIVVLAPVLASAAPYADYVIDVRTGEVLHQENADTRLHPASLTKMMTLYVAFEAIERGEISLDSKVTISKKAAAEPPSKLGLKAGQTIALRYLLRAAAVKSANDAATAIGEAIEGSEAAFARRMTRTAKALGMTKTTFANANGLTAKGHLSTARDMTILGRHLFYDYPQYYNLFSRTSADAGIAKVASTNSRFLASYKGADGIKTGYTSAAGFNLVASAERGNKRIIATVFGGKSTASRNARIVELLDAGFRKAPNRATVQKPSRPVYIAEAEALGDEVADSVARAVTTASGAVAAGKTIRLNVAIKVSPRPRARPLPGQDFPQEDILVAQKDIAAALAEIAALDLDQAAAAAEADPAGEEVAAVAPETAADAGFGATAPQPETLAALNTDPGTMPATEAPAPTIVAASAIAPQRSPKPLSAPRQPVLAEVPAAALAEGTSGQPPAPPVAEAPQQAADVAAVLIAADDVAADPTDEAVAEAIAFGQTPTATPAVIVATASDAPAPKPRPAPIVLAAYTPAEDLGEDALEVVTRVSTSGGRQWSINVGHFGARYNAERQLLQTALVEANTLEEAQGKVIARKGGFDANFIGMTEEMAALACRRLQARQTECTIVGP